MLKKETLEELEIILSVQNDILYKINNNIEKIKMSFESNEDVKNSLIRLEEIMKFLEENSDYLEEDDFEGFNGKNILDIYQEKRNLIQEDIQKLDYKDWDSYISECIKYKISNLEEGFIPYESLLSEKDLELIREKSYEHKYKFDKLDYIFIGIAAIIGSLIDIFMVKIPKCINTGKYKQEGSPITKILQNLRLPKEWQIKLEKEALACYDNTGGCDHRSDTLGHDPVLGLIFGVIDIIKGNATVIKNGNIDIRHITDTKHTLKEAIIIQILHLLSDIATKKGLPVPFNSLFKLIDKGNFKRANGKTATVSQLVTWMYHHGYDFRHFVTMGITPMSIEIILRGYIMIRHYIESNDDEIKTFNLAKNPKYRLMLLSAHAITSAVNAGKVVLYQGNPLAINYAEWMALIRYLIPSLKYWIFDKSNMELEYLEKITDDLWDELLVNSYKILDGIEYENISVIELGKI